MASVSALEFATHVVDACQSSTVTQSYSVSIQDNLIVKVRADLRPNLFVDIFYNAGTDKTSFALIESGIRIFGADNTAGWHTHPFDAPGSHESSEPITFNEFLQTVAEWLNREASR